MSAPANASAASVDRVMSRDIVCSWQASRPALLLGPDHPLFLLRHRREALVDELLHALALVGLGCIDVALRVGRDAVDGVELAGLPAAVAERGEFGHRQSIEDMNLLVGAVGEVEVFLVAILREGNVPHGAVALRVLLDE